MPCNFLLKAGYGVPSKIYLGRQAFRGDFIFIWCGVRLLLLFAVALGQGLKFLLMSLFLFPVVFGFP